MTRCLLHLLLALTLALNGISAPWAMARMSHADHGTSGDRTAEVKASLAEHAHHGGHAGHGDHSGPGLASRDANPVASSDGTHGSCCDGTACQCGCVLPPVVPLFALSLQADRLSTVPFVFPPQRAVIRRGSPPFRPPAA